MRFSIEASFALVVVTGVWSTGFSQEIVSGPKGELSHRSLTNKTPLPKIEIVGDNGGAHFPLGLCQGDCDRDEDCKGHLICFQRGANEPVPGCRGGVADNSRGDYCIAPPHHIGQGGPMSGSGGGHHPVPAPAPVPMTHPPPDHPSPENALPPGPFYIQMYWREGYRWPEFPWCMKCDGGRCRENKELYLEACGRRLSFFSRPPTAFKFREIGGGAVQLQVVPPPGFFSHKKFCLERRGSEVRLEGCNRGNVLQHWVSPRGRFDGIRFELSPWNDSSLCITQNHLPKHNEKLKLQSCHAARGDQTALWTRYYP